MNEEHVEINSDGLVLKGLICKPAVASWPLVVLCHGLLSHKHGSKYRQLSKVFAESGIACLRFDFRGCGESDGYLWQSSVVGRWRDLQKAIDLTRTVQGFDGRLGLLGSSLGGYLALLEASRNPHVRCVVTWATPSHLADLAGRLAEVAPVFMSEGFYEDLVDVELLSRLENVQRVLIVHGRLDRQVPAEHASKLFAAVREPKALHLFEDADHSFSQAAARDQAVRYSLEWFQKYL